MGAKSLHGSVIVVTLVSLLILPVYSDTEHISRPALSSFQITSPQSRSQIDPDLKILYTELLVHFKFGRYDKVIVGSKEILAQDSSFIDAYYLLVQSTSKLTESASSDESGQAIHFFGELLEEDSENIFYCFGLGLSEKHRGNFQDGKKYFSECIRLGAGFWAVYEELIDSLNDRAEYEDTISRFKNLIKSDPENYCLSLGLGRIYFWLNDYNASEAYFNQALKLIQRKKAKKAEARCLYYLAHLFVYLNDYSKATNLIKESLRISKGIEDRLEEANSLQLLGGIYFETGNHDEAFNVNTQALIIAKQIASEKIEAICLMMLGMTNTEIGRYSAAEENFKKSIRYYMSLNELQRLGIDYYWLSTLYKETGDYSKALESARKGLKISQQLEFKTGETFHLALIGDIYLSLGNYEKALKYNKDALAISEVYTSKWSREECFNTIGYVYLEMNAYHEALDYFQRALDYVQNIEHTREEAECLYNLGVANFKKGDETKALSYFLQSLKKSDLMGKKAIKGKNLNRLGDLSRESHRINKSQEYYLEALSIGTEIGHPNIIWEAYSGLGEISACHQDFLSAVDYYKKAIEVIEDLRSQFLITEYRSGFFKSKIRIYENLVAMLYELYTRNPSDRYGLECFYYAEKAKARAFLDDLQKARIDFRILFHDSQSGTIELSKRISHILTQLSSYQLRSFKRKELWDELEVVEEDLQNQIEEILRKNPKYARTIGLAPLRLDEIQKVLLNKGIGLIEYMVGEKNIFIFSCTQNRLVIHKILSENQSSTLELVNNYIRLLSSRRFTNADCESAGRRLYESLFSPISWCFEKKIDRLIIIPDRGLHYLPFETLVCENSDTNGKNRPTYLMEHYRISYAPSAASLIQIINKNSPTEIQRDLLAVGDPVYEFPNKLSNDSTGSEDIVQEYYLEKRFNLQPLRFAFKEIRSISRLFSKNASMIIAQINATEEKLKSIPLDNFRIIHFATHSLLDEKNSNRSALVLNLDDDPEEDGFFQIQEIYSTRLNADLVVLSACQTAKGKIEKGEGIQGMTRAFFYAGTKSVLASLWNIDDKSTANLMTYFYRFLSRGLTIQEALNKAKIKMLNSEYRSPYFWAAFVLIGDSDRRIDFHTSSPIERILSFLRLN